MERLIDSKSIRRILVVKTHALGDVLMVTPALRALRRCFPDAELHFLVGEWSHPAIETSPWIDRIIPVPDPVFFERRILAILQLVRRLRKERYDLAVIFQPSQIVRKMIKLSGAGKLAGLYSRRKPRNLDYAAPWRTDENRYVGKDFFSAVEVLGCRDDGLGMDFFVKPEIRAEMDTFLQNQWGKQERFVVVCPGGGRNPRDFVRQKIWPPDRYIRIIQRLVDSGYHVIVVGSGSDTVDTERMNRIPRVLNLVGKTSFQQLGAVFQRAQMVITNDSAPLHLAQACHCPVVCIFGPSRWQSLVPEHARVLPVAAEIACAPCYNNAPFPGCGKDDCIESITVDQVWAAVERGFQKWCR